MKNLIFIGMIGGGMKSVAAEAANTLGRKFVDTDEVLIRNTGLSLHDIYTMLPLDSFRELTLRLALQLSEAEDYVIAVGDSILKNDSAMTALKSTAFSIYIEHDTDLIAQNCTETDHPLLARGLHRLYELYNERKELFPGYADTTIPFSPNAAEASLTAYNANAGITEAQDPALYAFFRYYIEKLSPGANSSSFAEECCRAVDTIIKKYIPE